MTKDINSPFNWRLRTGPSIFAKDVNFRPRKDGKSIGEVQTEIVESKRARGEMPGVVHGLGTKETIKAREERMLAYKQFGVYSKAVPSIKHPNKHEK